MHCLILSLLVLITSIAHGHDIEPVIYSSKQGALSSEVTSSVDVLYQNDLTKHGGERLSDKLKGLAGVEVVQTGVSAGQAAVFLRGLDARHTAFAIDGVRIFDAASIQRLLNPSLISAFDIERIEVLKGAQSVLYGSDAIGGVINIITRKNNLKNEIGLDVGVQTRLNTSHSFLWNKLSLHLKTFYQEDLVHNDLNFGSEIDKKFNKGAALDFSYTGNSFESSTNMKLLSDFSEVDGQDFVTDLPEEDDSSFAEVDQFIFLQNFKWHLGKDSELNLNLSHQNTKRLNSSDTFEGRFRGSLEQAELRYVKEKTLLGFISSVEIYNDDEISNLRSENVDFFANQSFGIGSLQMEFGARLTNNRFYGDHLVYNAGLSKKLSSHRFHLSSKSGFKAPSPYQLFGITPFGRVGNEDLNPEKSVSYEIGYQLNRELGKVGANLFSNYLEQAIEFRNNTYVNSSSITTRGIEFMGELRLSKLVSNINFTYLDIENNAQRIVERRPKESFNMNLFYAISELENIGLTYRYRGVRFEDIAGRAGILSAYSVFDFNYEKKYKSYLLSIKILNLFDEKYEEAHLFATQRFGLQGRLAYSY